MNIWKSAHSYYSSGKYLLKPQCDKTIPSRVAKVKKTCNSLLTTAWGTRPCTLFMRMSVVIFSGNCLTVPSIDEDPQILWCSSSSPKCIWRRQESICLADPEWKLLKCSSLVERMRKFSYIHTMELHINEHEECTPTWKI